LRSAFFIFCFFLVSFLANAQQVRVSGMIRDQADTSALIGASVFIKSLPDSATVAVSTTDADGRFSFDAINSGTYVIQCTYVGYQMYKRVMELGINPVVRLDILMKSDGITLGGVEVIGRTPPVTQKGDTSEIRANQFKVNPDANAEDLVTKMPGITKVDGKIQAQGEEVKRVMVDGAVFFGSDPNATLRNLPAEMIDKIQIYDKASDQAQFTGISDGNEEKTINIITKPDFRQGQFGRVFAGYAPEDKYKAGGVYNSFNKDKRLTVIGQTNNINEQNFSPDDVAALQTTGGGGGGRGRGPGGGRFGRSDNPFQTNTSGGIVTTNALGINYTDKWADKVTFQGSAFGNMTNTELLQSSFTQFFTDQNSRDTTSSLRDAKSFRLNARVEYNIDSMQSVLYTPSFNYGFNNSNYLTESQLFNNGILQSQNNNNSISDGRNMSFSNDLMYRRRFSKPGRTVALSLKQAYTNNLPRTDQNLYTLSYDSVTVDLVDKQFVESNNYNRSYSAEIDYTEPLIKDHFLVVEYNYTIKNNDIDKRTYDVDNGEQPSPSNLNQDLSNVTDNLYDSHRPEISYKYQNKNFNFSTGVQYQYSTLRTDKTYPTTDKIKKSFTNVLPNAMLRYSIDRTKNIRVFYRSSTQEPSVTQLQSVIDNSNTLQLTSGNPDLNQSTSHRLFFHYSTINPQTGSNIFVGGGGQTTQDYIGEQVISAKSDTIISGYGILPSGGQYRYPINLNGYYNVRGFGSYGFPFYLIKSNVNFNLNASFTNSPSKINQLINNSKSTNLGGGISIASNFSQNLDFTVSTQVAFSDVKNDVNVSSNNFYYNQNTSARINWIFLDHFVVNTDFTYFYNHGLSSNSNTSYALWNAGVGYKFLKKNAAEIRLQAFDLLNNNTAITRNITATYYEDVNSNVLNRYLMLMFSYKF